MGKIDELIQQYCPDGVEYVSLSQVCQSIKTGKLNANAMVEGGQYPFFTCSDKVYTIDKYSFDTEALLVAGNGYLGNVKYYKGKFDAYQRTYVLSDFARGVDIMYVYYAMQNSFRDYALKSQKDGSVPYITIGIFDSYCIPIPPLPVQEEIVNILDRFAVYAAELQAELQARQQQYNYYRDTLLSFKSRDDVEWKKLGEIEKCHCSGSTPTKSKKEYYDNGTIPWLRTQDVKFNEITEVDSFITEVAVKKTSVKWIPENCVIVAISGATAGRCAINKIKTTTNQHCLNIEIDDRKALYKYVFYCVCNQYNELISLKQGARGDLNSSSILNVKIPVPSLSEQQRIVNILDRFDTLVNDLSQGLPAEIEARRQQYEYYRDKLLTFKRKEE